jgi:hypothetical protein
MSIFSERNNDNKQIGYMGQTRNHDVSDNLTMRHGLVAEVKR